jgi:hypothetical protein
MRKYMTKEVTKTTVKIASMEMVAGIPKAIPLPDVVLIGNVSLEKAQKEVNKLHDRATVLNVESETVVYEMLVEDFIKVAKVKE